MKSKLLILGSTGTVGSELIKLLRNDFQVYAIYRKKNINKIKNIIWIDKKKIKTIQKYKFKFIINCLAVHSFSKKQKIFDYVESNIYLFLEIIKNINKSAIICNLSTISKFDLNNKKINESSDYSYSSLLAVTKNALDKILFFQNKKYINLLLPGVLSLNKDFKRPILKQIILDIKKNKKIRIYNTKIKFNSFIDTIEIYKFIMHINNLANLKSGDYILAPNPNLKFIEIINFYKILYNSKSKIIDLGNDNKNYILSNKKIKTNFKFNISSPLDILKRYRI